MVIPYDPAGVFQDVDARRPALLQPPAKDGAEVSGKGVPRAHSQPGVSIAAAGPLTLNLTILNLSRHDNEAETG